MCCGYTEILNSLLQLTPVKELTLIFQNIEKLKIGVTEIRQAYIYE